MPEVDIHERPGGFNWGGVEQQRPEPEQDQDEENGEGGEGINNPN